ncbi:hypothetical protein BJY52DRAFT_799644 [Lactarius psammicola]|nr:hypothetical protein BJY52DRAFT_799644 [Lactarius psammicola]
MVAQRQSADGSTVIILVLLPARCLLVAPSASDTKRGARVCIEPNLFTKGCIAGPTTRILNNGSIAFRPGDDWSGETKTIERRSEGDAANTVSDGTNFDEDRW